MRRHLRCNQEFGTPRHVETVELAVACDGISTMQTIARTSLIWCITSFAVQLALPCVAENSSLDKAQPYSWSVITKRDPPQKDRDGSSSAATNDTMGKVPLFDQIVRPSELTPDQPENSAEADGYHSSKNDGQSDLRSTNSSNALFGNNGFDTVNSKASSRSTSRAQSNSAADNYRSQPSSLSPAATGRPRSSSREQVHGVPSGKTQRFEDVNLEVQLLERPWANVDTAQVKPRACIAMRRSDMDLALILTAEPLGVEFNADLSGLAKIAKNRLLGVYPSVVFTPEIEDTRNGIKGVTFEASALSPQGSKYWLLWVGTHNGFNYEFAVIGTTTNMLEASDASRDFLNHLRQIEPTRVAHTPPSHIATRYESKEFGYELDLTDLGWIKGKASATHTAAVDYYAFTGRESALVVLALPMPHRAPDMEALTASTMAGLGLDKPGTETVRSTPYKFGKLSCKEIEVRRDFDGKKTLARLRLIADDRCAYVLYGWSRADLKEEVARVQDSMDALRVLPHATLDFSKLPENQRIGCGLILNDIGLHTFASGDMVASLDYFRAALELGPTTEVFAANYLEMLGKLDRADEALAFLKDHDADFAKNQRIRALHAKMLCQKGENAAGLKMYADIFAGGSTDETTLTAYAEAAIAVKSYDQVITAIELVKQKRPTPEIERMEGGVYLLKGDFTAAVKLFEELHAKHSSDAKIAIALAGAYLQAKQFDAALAITQALLDTGNHDEPTLIAHGTIQLAMDQMSAAKQTFERAHELYPHSERINELIKVASSQLGEGENSCVKTPIEAVAVPPVVAKQIEQTKKSISSENTAEADAEELACVVGIHYEPAQPIRKTTTRRIKVYDQSGVARYSTLSYKFDAVFERLFVNQLVVRDETGAQVATGKVENYYVTDDTSSDEATNAKCLKIPVPSLKPGYTLECTVTRQTVALAKEFTLQEISLASESPCRVSAVFVQGAVDGLHTHASYGVQIKRADNLLYAMDTNLAAIHYEPHQPSVETFTPIVWFGDATKAWDTEAQSYLNKIQDRLCPDDTTKALAAEITRGCTTNREKLAAIAEHVQKGYTYHAIEFGRRAQIPNPAAKTIALKYGDCKDHALLTKQLLGAAGIESHLALVRTTSNVIEDVPSLDQFNHVVVYVPTEANGLEQNLIGGLFIDTTDKNADPLLDPVAELASRAVMVLDPKNPRFVHVPVLKSDAGKVATARTISFDIKSTGAADAHVTERITLNQYMAPSIRSYLRRVDSDARRDAIQSLLSHSGGQVRIKHLEITNLEAVSKPLQIDVEYTIPNSFHLVLTGGHKSLVGSLPCTWESEFSVAQAIDVRKTPFEVSIPRCIESSLTIQLPDGYQLSNLDQCNGSGRSKFRSWSASASQSADLVKIAYEVHIAPGLHPAADYEQFYSETNDSLAVLQTPVTLESTESHVETASHRNVGQNSR